MGDFSVLTGLTNEGSSLHCAWQPSPARQLLDCTCVDGSVLNPLENMYGPQGYVIHQKCLKPSRISK